MLEAEMDVSLGFTKNNKVDIKTVNKRNRTYSRINRTGTCLPYYTNFNN